MYSTNQKAHKGCEEYKKKRTLWRAVKMKRSEGGGFACKLTKEFEDTVAMYGKGLTYIHVWTKISHRSTFVTSVVQFTYNSTYHDHRMMARGRRYVSICSCISTWV